MEINIDKSQVIRVSKRNESLRFKVGNRELKEVDHFKYLGSVLTRDCYFPREIKVRIAVAKEAFNKKISLLTSKLSIKLWEKLIRCYVWNIDLCGSDTWAIRKLGPNYLEVSKCGTGGE
jgi:hypothetical protein